MAKGEKIEKIAGNNQDKKQPKRLQSLPTCELCGESEDSTYGCRRCGTSFCECCGDVDEEICINCLEEYTVEEEHEHIDYVNHVKPQEYRAVQKPERTMFTHADEMGDRR